MAKTGWVEVDLDGLAKTLSRKGKGWILRELVQNAFDEDGVTRVDITLTAVPNKPLCVLTIEDDSTAGFQRLHESWTLFGESKKKGDPTKAGRFLAGEKFVLAFCEEATIESMTGTVKFDQTHGRRLFKQKKRERGSLVTALIRMDRLEITELRIAANEILPPAGIEVRVDGVILPTPKPVVDFTA